MTVKSVVDVEVNDEQFRKFSENFEKYKKTLAATGVNWKDVGVQTKLVEGSFAAIVAATVAQVELLKKVEKAEKGSVNAASRSATLWSDMARSTRAVAGNIVRATESLLKWTALTTVFTGLLGAGGLFGIDRLALGVGGGRRSALGLGLSYGEQKAFGTNYGRVVDSDSFLSNVFDALHDVTKRSSLYGAGLTEGDIAGKNTAQIAAALLPHLKELADRTPDALLAQVLRARGLDQFVSVQDLQRLKATPASELAGYGAGYNRDRKTFALDDATQRKWQDFAVQLDRAGKTIETVFIQGLTPLTPSLAKLSNSFATAIKTLFDAAEKQHWVEAFGKGIEYVAKYIGSAQFQKDIKTFVEDIGILAKSIHAAIRWLGGNVVAPLANSPSSIGNGFSTSDPWWLQGLKGGALVGRGIGSIFSTGWSAYTSASNPGNIRVPGRGSGFATYGSAEDGVRAMARQIQRDILVHKLTNLSSLIGDRTWGYAPAADHNNVAAYVGSVSRETGIGANASLNGNDVGLISKIVAAMLHVENSRRNKGYTPQSVARILLQNNTGGNTIASASALGPSVVPAK